MSDIAFSTLKQQIKNCSYDEKISLLSLIADLLKPVPKTEKKSKRKLGGLKGQIWMSDDFDETYKSFTYFRACKSSENSQ